jgi:bifunctional N-acetylglucosamine-1-phosphate-uridyltransferase/glucosamine-1-phosphate-acetyltransferase GlmU-like protein
LPKLSNNNVQGEYYLTDIVAMAVADGLEIASIQPELEFEVEGVNDRLQLATLERQFQQQQAKELMQQGVHLIDPNRFDLRGTVKCGQDVQIDVNVIIEGDCELGDNVQLGAGCILKILVLRQALKFKPIAFLKMRSLEKTLKSVLSPVFVQAQILRMMCILATSSKLKILILV